MASVEAAVNGMECASGWVTGLEGINVDYYADYTSTDDIVEAIESVNGGQFSVTCVQPN